MKFATIRSYMSINGCCLVLVLCGNLFSVLLVELEMALAYWNIVLRDRFKFLDLWCQFLQVWKKITTCDDCMHICWSDVVSLFSAFAGV